MSASRASREATIVTDRYRNALAAVSTSVGARAAALDHGRTDVRQDLAELGRRRFFDPVFEKNGLATLVHLVEVVAGQSLAVGLSAWAHIMTLLYLQQSPTALRERHIDALRDGARQGATAMAPGLKQLAGLGDMPVIADKSGDVLRITGVIPWASNLFHSAVIVLPARSVAGDTYVVAVEADAPGVTINPLPEIMALGATASTSVRLQRVALSAAHVISTDLVGFVRHIRPSLLLLQTAMCLGVARSAIDAAQRDSGLLAAQFTDEVAALSERISEHGNRLYALSAEPSQCPIRDVVQLRLATATAAVSAARLEFTSTGGAAYATTSAANRRFREAAFLTIQSPTEGQLRRELQTNA